MTKTLLVDGNSLLQLGFHGLKNFQDKDTNLGAVFYFLNTLKKLLFRGVFLINQSTFKRNAQVAYRSRYRLIRSPLLQLGT